VNTSHSVRASCDTFGGAQRRGLADEQGGAERTVATAITAQGVEVKLDSSTTEPPMNEQRKMPRLNAETFEPATFGRIFNVTALAKFTTPSRMIGGAVSGYPVSDRMEA